MMHIVLALLALATFAMPQEKFSWDVGQNGTLTTNNTPALGMSLTPEMKITPGNIRRTPQAFSTLPACAAGTEGSFAAITDSTSNTWGATITGSGGNHVLGYCDGTAWTVAAK